jgi:hypothetical protein
VKTVIAFYSRSNEKIAMSAALGAIQERAGIRIRRLDPNSADANFEHEYIAPRDIDAEWAEVVLIASPDVPELRAYLESLDRLNPKVAIVRLDIDARPGLDTPEAARLAARAATANTASAV